MAHLIEFEGRRPKVAASAFLAPTATLIGDVVVEEDASIWFGAVLRGDFGPIRIGARTSIQDNCVAHAERGKGTVVGPDVTVGHGAILHDCHIERGALIGMGSILLEGVRIGAQSLIAAGSVVLDNFQVPERMLVAGVPARIKGPLGPNAGDWVERGAQEYVDMVARYRANSRIIE